MDGTPAGGAEPGFADGVYPAFISGAREYIRGASVNRAALLRSAVVALLRNKMRSVLTVLGITIGIAAVICVVAIGKAGQARVEQQLNNLGGNFLWIEAGGRAFNRDGPVTQQSRTVAMASSSH